MVQYDPMFNQPFNSINNANARPLQSSSSLYSTNSGSKLYKTYFHLINIIKLFLIFSRTYKSWLSTKCWICFSSTSSSWCIWWKYVWNSNCFWFSKCTTTKYAKLYISSNIIIFNLFFTEFFYSKIFIS